MPVLSLDAKPGMTGQQYAKVLEKVHRNVQKLASAEMRKYQNRIDARKSYEAKRRKKEEAEAEESAEDDEAEESDDSGALDSFGTPAVARPVPERQPRRTKRSASAALIASVASLPAKTKRACSPTHFGLAPFAAHARIVCCLHAQRRRCRSWAWCCGRQKRRKSAMRRRSAQRLRRARRPPSASQRRQQRPWRNASRRSL